MTDIIAPNPFPIVSVITADREALYGGLISAAHPVAYARQMADSLPDSDGSLQMLARYRLATRSPELERLGERIAEVVEEDGGCWHACSGCQESSEGYVSERDYPYSPIFKCQPGSGCGECGGIGVLWEDGAFLASYGETLSTPSATLEERATVERVTVAKAREKAEVHFSPGGCGAIGIEGYVRALRDFGLIAADPRQHDQVQA